MLTFILIAFATSPSDSLWMTLLTVLAGGGFLGAIVNWMELRARKGLIDVEIKGQLEADLIKLEIGTEARLRAETRAEAARLRQSYVNALPFHATLLRDHMSSVGDKLSRDDSRTQMKNWFENIKKYGNRNLFPGRDAKAAAMEFSAWLHYPLIFPMSTLYYTSVFFHFSQRIRTLAPFTEADSRLGDRLNNDLRAVEDAFARKDVQTDPAREAEKNGLWETVQNSMGAIVRKEDGYLTYPEFCMLFIDIEQPKRNDHVFMRAMDFFGADPGPLLTPEGARSIVRALNTLVDFLKEQQVIRETEEQKRSAKYAEKQ